MAAGAIGEQVAQQARIGGLVLFYEKLCKLGERMQVLPYGFPVPVVSGDGEQGAQGQQRCQREQERHPDAGGVRLCHAGTSAFVNHSLAAAAAP